MINGFFESFQEWREIYEENKMQEALENERSPYIPQTKMQKRKYELHLMSLYVSDLHEIECDQLQAESRFEELQKIEDLTVNQKLLRYAYGYNTYKSYKAWQEEGYQVKKGEKAVMFWSKPIKANEKDKDDASTDKELKAEQNQDQPTEANYTFYNIAFAFSQDQVKPIEQTEPQI